MISINVLRIQKKKPDCQVRSINTSTFLNLTNLPATLVVRIFFARPSFVASGFISAAFIRA